MNFKNQLFSTALSVFLVLLLADAVHAQGFPNSIRISTQGVDGVTNVDAFDPAVAYNATDDEFMVVWSGDTIPSEDEIWGQRISASTGALLGSVIRISDMGPTGSATYDAFAPAIAWNSNNNQYLVVWSGDDDTGGLINGENEIFGQLLSNTGAEIGADDFRVSFVGGTGNGALDAFDTDVAYNSVDNLFLVVWSGDSTDGEDEIQGQLVAANGSLVGGMVTISNQGPSGATSHDAEEPAVAYNATDNEFMVIWWGDVVVPGEEECFARRLAGATASPLDTARAISDMGPDGDANYDAGTGDVAWNSNTNEYLVVWDADDSSGVTISGENEIFGQLLSNTGVEIGANDFRISSLGTNLDGASDAFRPAVTYSPNCQEFVVAYEGDNINGSTVDGEIDVFISRISELGIVTGRDSAVTNAGIIGSGNFDCGGAAIAFSTTSNTYLVVNHGEDDAGMLADGENEIYGILKGCCAVPSFTSSGSIQIACLGSPFPINYTFNGSADSLRWELSTDGGTTWNPVSNNATYSGATTATLSINYVSGLNGYDYRLVAYACGSSSASQATTLVTDPLAPIISCPPDIVETPSTLNCNPSILWNAPIAVDNCTGATASGSSNPGDNFPVGTTNVLYTATDSAGNTDTCSFNVTVQTPVIPNAVTYSNGNLCATISGATYQWYEGGNLISGATAQCYFPTTPGTYTVFITDGTGCTGTADFQVTVVGVDPGFASIPHIYPNPASGLLNIRFETLPLEKVELRLTDLRGKIIQESAMEDSQTASLDLSTLPEGIYLLHLQSREGRMTQKIIVAR